MRTLADQAAPDHQVDVDIFAQMEPRPGLPGLVAAALAVARIALHVDDAVDELMDGILFVTILPNKIM